MERYETKKELVQAILKPLEAKIYAAANWQGPYDGLDKQQVESKIKLKGTPGNNKRIRTKGSRPEPILNYEQLDDLISDFRNYGKQVRREIGVKNPIPTDKTPQAFRELGWKIIDPNVASDDRDEAAFFPYIVNDSQISGYRYCHVKTVAVAGNNTKQKLDIFYLLSAMTFLSSLTHVQSPIALAIILSDITDFPNVVSLVVDEFKQISINVFSPDITPKTVSAMYTLARGEKQLRYRQASERTKSLLEFVHNNKRLKWVELFDLWGQQFPGQQYQDVNSMRTAFYKARTKWQKSESTNLAKEA